MSEWKNEAEARQEILEKVTEYYHAFKEKKEAFKEGDRITYAAVFLMKKRCAHLRMPHWTFG